MVGCVTSLIHIAVLCCSDAHLSLLQAALATGHYLTVPFHNMEELVIGMKHNHFACTVLDFLSPSASDGETVRSLKALSRGTPLIVVSDRCDISTAVELMKAGAADLMVGEPNSDHLLTMVADVISRSSAVKASGLAAGDVAERVLKLTAREVDVVELITQGYKNLEVAALLGISFRTAETYRKSAMRKLRVNSICDIVKLTMDIDFTELRTVRTRIGSSPGA